MKLIAILITTKATTYGGAQSLRQVVLLVFILLKHFLFIIQLQSC